ncbi:hypothetical protein IGJ02_000171 [Enterococcus sp. DIV0724b]|uniref:putative quinol monooxygenase n=1 Tax=Enterococcus sp. DIV0724b TaxID=2774694 RepID=UPI003D2FF3B9
MITLNVFFDLNPVYKEDFLKLLNNMVVESNKETGCTYYHLLEDQTQENRFTLIEHWDDQTALDGHNKTAHWINFNNTVNDYLNHPYEEHHYTEIDF